MNAPTALLARTALLAPTALLLTTLLLVAAGCGRYGPPQRSPQAAPEAPGAEAPQADEEPQADDERERPR